MSVTAAQLLVRVQASGVNETKDALAGVGKESDHAQSKSDGLLKTIAGFAGGAALVNITGGAFSFLKDQVVSSFQAGLNANSIMDQLAAGLKSTHDASGMTTQSLSDLADTITNYSGISDDAVKTGEAMLLTFTGLSKDVYPAATRAVADMATKMAGGAIPSAQQMQQQALLLGKALNDPTKGITALTREGVTFTQKQKDQIAAMEKAGDTAGAQKVILGELSKEFGGSAKAAGQANGGLAILSAKFDDMKQKIGQALIPVISKLFAAFAPVVSQLQAALPGALKAVSGFITEQMLPAVNNFSSWMKTDGAPLLKRLAHAFKEDVLPAIKDLASFITGTFVPAVKNIGEKLGNFINYLGTHKDALTAFKATLAGVAAAIGVVLVGAFVSWAVAAGAAAIATIAATWPILAVAAGIGLLTVGIVELVSHWGDISKFFGKIKDAIGNFFSGLGTTMHKLVDKWKQTGHDIVQGLIDGVKNMIGNATKAIGDLGGSMLKSIKGLFGVHSPSTVFAEIGKNLSQGLVNGVRGVDVAGAVNAHLSGAIPSLSAGVNVGVSGAITRGGGGVGASYGPGRSSSSRTTQHITIYLDRRVISQAVVEDLPNIVRMGTGIRHI